MKNLTAGLVAVGLLVGSFCCVPTEPDGDDVPGSKRFRADAGEGISAGQGDSVTLQALGTNGTEPYIFRWSVERTPAGAGEVTLDDPTAAVTTTSPLDTQGDYVFRVVVIDAAGRDSYSFVTVDVGEPGSATTSPLSLSAGGPDILYTGKGGELSVEIEEDEDFDEISYVWKVVSGDAALDDPTAAHPMLTAFADETVEVQVEVTAAKAGEDRVGETSVFVVAVAEDRPVVVFTIPGFGELLFELRADVAPKTSANLLRYVDQGFYDGIVIHRVEKGFVIQAGGYKLDENGELERIQPRDPIPSEADNGLSNVRGTVAMALSGGDVDSGTSQWFINLVDNNGEGDSTDLDAKGFTVFATIVEDGMDIVDQMAAVEIENRGAGLSNAPVEDIIIESARRRSTPPGPIGVTIISGEELHVGSLAQFDAEIALENEDDLTFLWEMVEGDLELTTPDQKSTNVTVPPDHPLGPVTVRLTVTNTITGDVGTAEATIQITEATTSPLSLSAGGPDILYTGEGGELSVEIEEDEDFDEISYVWKVASGNAALDDPTAAHPMLTAFADETVEVQVEVTATKAGEDRVGETSVFVVTVAEDRPVVVFTIPGFGELLFELRADVAPKTSANLLRYVDEGFYDGIVIHRVVEGFVIQAGGYKLDENGELERIQPRDPVLSEADNGLSNVRGTVAMALSGGDVDSGTSQWFINLVDNNGEGDSTDLDAKEFTVFATIVEEGMDIVDQMAAVEIENRGAGLSNAPVEDIIIESARRRSTQKIEN
ncbi:MAG: peptidylprolyl isomerase [Phycisphaerae bacterium]|nr:peptidylprolyl isomerase [Phycisphaerae bacterium]